MRRFAMSMRIRSFLTNTIFSFGSTSAASIERVMHSSAASSTRAYIPKRSRLGIFLPTICASLYTSVSIWTIGVKISVGGGLGHEDFFEKIISLENLLLSWQEFKRGKIKKRDVQEFYSNLEENLFALHRDLKNKTYTHGGYRHFKISDPKPRDIHKASVRDRLLHHALYRRLYPYFESKFIFDSYSCRVGKGTHRAMNRFQVFARKVSKNHTRTAWVLKCDVRRFFASIDHTTLIEVLAQHNLDADTRWLLARVIGSFPKGLPLGNLTSQLLVNVYMNEFDQWVEHILKTKYYVRYADDFVILSHERRYLQQLLPQLEIFLKEKLKLDLHPEKVFIKTFASGIDFLGWVHFPYHRVLRTATQKRMFRRLAERKGSEGEEATKASYQGMLKHGNTYGLQQKIDA